jgi:hypothetical protein
VIKKILNIAVWVSGTGVVLAGIFFASVKYVAWEQIREDRATKADSVMIQEFRYVKVNVDTILLKIDNIEVKQNIQIGGLKAIDRSYSKHLKDKDEQIEYLQMQNEELKKK